MCEKPSDLRYIHIYMYFKSSLEPCNSNMHQPPTTSPTSFSLPTQVHTSILRKYIEIYIYARSSQCARLYTYEYKNKHWTWRNWDSNIITTYKFIFSSAYIILSSMYNCIYTFYMCIYSSIFFLFLQRFSAKLVEKPNWLQIESELYAIMVSNKIENSKVFFFIFSWYIAGEDFFLIRGTKNLILCGSWHFYEWKNDVNFVQDAFVIRMSSRVHIVALWLTVECTVEMEYFCNIVHVDSLWYRVCAFFVLCLYIHGILCSNKLCIYAAWALTFVQELSLCPCI